MLGAFGRDRARLGPALEHLEIYCPSGLLGALWHGPPDAETVVVLLPGALGGFLGPAKGLFHAVGVQQGDAGRGAIRVDYRRPNDLDACLLDAAAMCEIATRQGAERFIFVGHSFGGAVAVQAGVVLGRSTAGVATLSTQSAGCEVADQLVDTPLLLLHGADDTILPPDSSAMVRMIAGHGDFEVLPGADHSLNSARADVLARLDAFISTTD